MNLYSDNSAEVLDAIHLLEAAVLKATENVDRASAMGDGQVAMLQAELDRLDRELQHYRRVYAAEIAQHLRS
jgi:hypothetical protein